MTEQNLFHNRSEQDDRERHDRDETDDVRDLLGVLGAHDVTGDPRLNQVGDDDEPVLHEDSEPDPFDRVVQVRLDALLFIQLQVGPEQEDRDDDCQAEPDSEPESGRRRRDPFRTQSANQYRKELNKRVEQNRDDMPNPNVRRHRKTGIYRLV